MGRHAGGDQEERDISYMSTTMATASLIQQAPVICEPVVSGAPYSFTELTWRIGEGVSTIPRDV